jgi:hypothetical protein
MNEVRVFGEGVFEDRLLSLSELEQELGASGGERMSADGAVRAYPVCALLRMASETTTEPAYFEVCGRDGFFARLPWRFAERSVLQFDTKSDGRTGGLRLRIADSPKACLNVKEIVEIRVGSGANLTDPVSGKRQPGSA